MKSPSRLAEKFIWTPTVNLRQFVWLIRCWQRPATMSPRSLLTLVCVSGCSTVYIYIYNSVCADQDAEHTLLTFLCHPSLHCVEMTSLPSPLLPISRHLQRGWSTPSLPLPSPTLFFSLSLGQSHSAMYRANQTALEYESTQCCGQTVRPLSNSPHGFWTLCPRVGSSYYNRINVYLSLSVTLLLSHVWQDGFAVNTSLERETVPDSRLWGFHPRHLWNNNIKSVFLCWSFLGD